MKILFLLLLVAGTVSISAQQYPDRHSTDIADSWISCQETQNPNKVREEGHWIMYDFGNEYTLQGTTLWNINGYQETDKGTQELVIDYSIDGVNWTELGHHTLEEGPASSFYEGEEGPDFEGANARYVIITSLSNYGHATCAGLSEVRFQATIASDTNTEEETLAETNISVSPNPFANQTKITISDLDVGEYVYRVLDISGKVVLDGIVNISSSKTFVELNMHNLASGSYVFSLEYGTLSLNKQLQLVK